jgi:hypothetical protein
VGRATPISSCRNTVVARQAASWGGAAAQPAWDGPEDAQRLRSGSGAGATGLRFAGLPGPSHHHHQALQQGPHRLRPMPRSRPRPACSTDGRLTRGAGRVEHKVVQPRRQRRQQRGGQRIQRLCQQAAALAAQGACQQRAPAVAAWVVGEPRQDQLGGQRGGGGRCDHKRHHRKPQQPGACDGRRSEYVRGPVPLPRCLRLLDIPQEAVLAGRQRRGCDGCVQRVRARRAAAATHQTRSERNRGLRHAGSAAESAPR